MSQDFEIIEDGSDGNQLELEGVRGDATGGELEYQGPLRS